MMGEIGTNTQNHNKLDNCNSQLSAVKKNQDKVSAYSILT